MKGLVLLLALAPTAAQDLPPYQGWVTDLAGFLEPAERQELAQRLESYERGSGDEVAVLTVPELEGRDLEDFAYELATQWGVGKQGLDNGVLLLVARDERRIRIEVGAGVEGRLTDLLSGRIIDLVMVPEFRAGRPAQGIRDGAEAIMGALGGDFSLIPEAPPRRQHGTGFGIFAFAIAIFVIVSIMRSRRGGGGGGGGGLWTAMFLGSALGSGRTGHGGMWSGGSMGGFGGGGFGGGGFSGGGASGGW